MNLYKISQDKNNGWDTYDSAVVAAETEDDAKTIHQDGNRSLPDDEWTSWVNSPNDVSAELIGVAKATTERGVIVASFNAG